MYRVKVVKVADLKFANIGGGDCLEKTDLQKLENLGGRKRSLAGFEGG